ncbi:MAG: hypothetical protein ACOCRK_00635 [bacterium]
MPSKKIEKLKQDMSQEDMICQIYLWLRDMNKSYRKEKGKKPAGHVTSYNMFVKYYKEAIKDELKEEGILDENDSASKSFPFNSKYSKIISKKWSEHKEANDEVFKDCEEKKDKTNKERSEGIKEAEAEAKAETKPEEKETPVKKSKKGKKKAEKKKVDKKKAEKKKASSSKKKGGGNKKETKPPVAVDESSDESSDDETSE